MTAAPEFSMILQKPSGEMHHGGGKRLEKGEAAYGVLARWIKAGTPRTPKTDPVLLRISVEPADRILTAGAEQQLVVTGHYSDKSARDVTHLTMFQSNDSVR